MPPLFGRADLARIQRFKAMPMSYQACPLHVLVDGANVRRLNA